jgi:hypothetical protein
LVTGFFFGCGVGVTTSVVSIEACVSMVSLRLIGSNSSKLATKSA